MVPSKCYDHLVNKVAIFNDRIIYSMCYKMTNSFNLKNLRNQRLGCKMMIHQMLSILTICSKMDKLDHLINL